MGWSNQVVSFLEAGFTIIDDSGMFVYSSTPAAGNLIASITPTGSEFTDQFGNMVVAGGFVSYDEYSPGLWIAVQHNADGIKVWGASSYAGPYSATGTDLSFSASGLGVIAWTGAGFGFTSTADANTYGPGPQMQNSATPQPVTSTTPANITGTLANMAAGGTYKVRHKIFYTGTASGGLPKFTYVTPTLTSAYGYHWWPVTSNYNQNAGTLPASFTGPTLAASTVSLLIENDVHVSSSSATTAYALQASENTSGDSFTINAVATEVLPG